MGILRQSVEIPALPYEVAEWLLQYTARAYESILSLKGESYQLSQEQPQWSDQDQRYVMELRAVGPLFLRARAKKTDWFVRVRIRKSEKRGFPTEVTVSCNVGGDVGKYHGKLVTAMQGQWPGAEVHFLGSPEDEPGAGWIRSEVVPGSAGHFRVTMERLYIRYRYDGWVSSSGDKLRFSRNTHTDDKRGTWAVTLRREDEPPCFAGIEAYEQSNGDTLVEFRDGYEPGSRWRVSPIGPSFAEFSDLILMEVPKGKDYPLPMTTEPIRVCEASDIRVPSRSADLRRWQATWRYVKGQAKQAKSYESICGWLHKTHPHLECSPETLADILRAGEAGLLD